MRKNNKAEKTVRTAHVLGRGLFDTFSFFSAQILLARKLDVFTEGFTTHIHFIWLLCSFFSTHILFTSVTSWLSFTTRYVLTELYYTHTFQVCTQIVLHFRWRMLTYADVCWRMLLRLYYTSMSPLSGLSSAFTKHIHFASFTALLSFLLHT